MLPLVREQRRRPGIVMPLGKLKFLVRAWLTARLLQVWNAVNNLLDDYSHGVLHDFDKPTQKEQENLDKPAQKEQENLGDGDAYQVEALKLHLKVRASDNPDCAWILRSIRCQRCIV